MRIIILILLWPSLAFGLEWVDLSVGESTYFGGKEIKILSQSVDYVAVSVDGTWARLELYENDCGSPRGQLFKNVSGIQIMAELASDTSNYCREPELDRLSERMRFYLSNGARIVLMSGGESLPSGTFPIVMNDPCNFIREWQQKYHASNVYYGIHAGLDFNYPTIGAQVVATMPGRIIEIVTNQASGLPCNGRTNTVGNYVKLENSNYHHAYLHLDSVNPTLQLGDWVNEGDNIGELGCTGTFAPHLHFTLKNRNGQNGLSVINAYPFLEHWACNSSTPAPTPPPPVPVVQDLDFCRDWGPCAEGEGDCDNDLECVGGTYCKQVEGVDVCTKCQ